MMKATIEILDVEEKLFRQIECLSMRERFRSAFGEHFIISQSGETARLSGIRIAIRGNILIGDNIEAGYECYFDFDNGKSLTPHHFTRMNRMEDIYARYPAIN